MTVRETGFTYTENDKMKAAYALNLCTVSISQIVDYKDINILNQEYENILNNLNLEQIPKDEALLDVLKIILDVITFFRISHGDQQLIDLEYQHRMQNAVWAAIPNVGMIFATGNPIAMGLTLATQVGIGYMNYRRHKSEYQLNRQKEEWESMCKVLEQLNGLRKELFETSWRLAQEYHFPDAYRLTDDQIHKYNEILMDGNDLKRFYKLDAIKEEFIAYPQFWYQLGSTANSIYRDAELGLEKSLRVHFRDCAIASFQKYEQLNQFNILRNDILTSAWALEYVDLLNLTSATDREKAKSLIQTAEKYSGKANDVLELCAYAYLKVSDHKNAARLFFHLVNQDYNIPVTAKMLSALYILKSREQGEAASAIADYKMLERLVSSECILPMPDPNENLETWNPIWRTVLDTQNGEEETLLETFRLATLGDPDAQCDIGLCYATGDGLETDEYEATEWFHKAAEQGHAGAQYLLGVSYYYGQGVGEDAEQAAQWYLKAAQQGVADAQFELAKLFSTGDGISENAREAFYWFYKAAEQGHAEAQFRLGLCYSSGDGIAEDAKKAVSWYEKAAEQGHPVAQYLLGLCYAAGEGIEKNPVEAVYWYKKAAEQDEPNALLCLGVCYMYGTGDIVSGSFGVMKDLQLSREYLCRAIEIGEREGFLDDNSDRARAHCCLAQVIYAQNVRDTLNLNALDIANCIPGVNFVSWTLTGAISISERATLKKFLTTEEGRSMMFHCKTAADLGDKNALDMLKKLRKAL